jgi:hypothetical protein
LVLKITGKERGCCALSSEDNTAITIANSDQNPFKFTGKLIKAGTWYLSQRNSYEV